jgi:hypothetical protein
MRRLALVSLFAVVALVLSCRPAQAASMWASGPAGDGRHAQVSADPAASGASKVVTSRALPGVSPPSVVVFAIVMFALVAILLLRPPALGARGTRLARAPPVQLA